MAVFGQLVINGGLVKTIGLQVKEGGKKIINQYLLTTITETGRIGQRK